jgi:hypothetical protein
MCYGAVVMQSTAMAHLHQLHVSITHVIQRAVVQPAACNANKPLHGNNVPAPAIFAKQGQLLHLPITHALLCKAATVGAAATVH